jgi:hypothetical protein
MKITYDHFYGQQENASIQLYNANLQCEPHEEREALENGWLLYNNQWYQSRSTRIVLSDWKYDKTVYNYDVRFVDTPSEEYKVVWYRYLYNKKFEPIYDPFVATERDVWMEYYWRGCTFPDKLRGFTKFVKYNGGLESQFNAYIIHVQWEFGQEMLNCEVEYAKSLGLQHLYIGSGYEKSSIYKAHLSGFEWWTGSEWSRDRNAYIELCKRDSKISNLGDLINLANSA